MYINNWFGDLDASRDKNLHVCFTELTSHLNAMASEIYSIRAFKGSGKTAFLRQLEHCALKPNYCQKSCPLTHKLCDIYDNYFVVPVNVTEISFETLLQISKTHTDPRYEMTEMLRSILKSYFVVKLNEYLKQQEVYNKEYVELNKLLKTHSILNTTKGFIRETIILAERAFTNGESFSILLSNQFFSSNIEKAYNSCNEIVTKHNIRVLILLDQFDEIIDLFKSPGGQRFYYHQTVAASLLKLTYDIDYLNNEIINFPNGNIQIKNLFPEDLYSILIPRDKQKYDQHSLKLQWNRSSLCIFIAKRIAVFLDTSYREEEKERFISKLLGKKIYNTFYNTLEDTYDYLLRHTLFKPRDLQQLLVSISNELINRRNITSKEQFIKCLPFQPEIVKEGIKEGTISIIDYLKIEFEAINLAAILTSLRNKPNINVYGDFYNFVAKSKINFEIVDLKKIIKKLWEIGVIGHLVKGDSMLHETYRKHKVVKNGSDHYVSLFTFSWRNNYDFSPTDLVVISPMFYDYLDSNVDKKIIIYPF